MQKIKENHNFLKQIHL